MSKMDDQRVRALLGCWAYWRGSVRKVLLSHMQPRCLLGGLVHSARQGGEIWEHNEIREPELPDDLMSHVDRVVCSLSDELHDLIRVVYVEGRDWSVARRARRLGISRREYHYRLKEAHELISSQIDWRNVLVA